MGEYDSPSKPQIGISLVGVFFVFCRFLVLSHKKQSDNAISYMENGVLIFFILAEGPILTEVLLLLITFHPFFLGFGTGADPHQYN